MKSLITTIFYCLLFNFTSSAQVDYSADIQPIFNSNCVSCHGGTSNVRLNNYSATMNSVGSRYGRLIVVPGDADDSPLVEKLNPNPTHGNRMPNNSGLPSEQIALIEQWVNEGASETVTSIEDNEIVNEFKIIGNYPNPFNPNTQIKFSLPQTGSIDFFIYSVNGQLILSNAFTFQAGQNTIDVNLKNQSSGLYLYRINRLGLNGSIESLTGKMLLIK